jgi:hypothetical protein
MDNEDFGSKDNEEFRRSLIIVTLGHLFEWIYSFGFTFFRVLGLKASITLTHLHNTVFVSLCELSNVNFKQN